MNDSTKISWTHWPGRIGRTWNPLRGCTRISAGCQNCYAEAIASRFSYAVEKDGELQDGPFTRFVTPENRWSGEVEELLEVVEKERRRRHSPRSVVFVCSMSDLFHDKVTTQFIDRIVRVAWERQDDVYLSLTKRAGRMGAYWRHHQMPPNWWQGVSVEDQVSAHFRLPHLKGIERSFVSFEPLLHNRVEWPSYLDVPKWAILGGESGPGSREMHLRGMIDLAWSLRERGTRVYVKQDSGRYPERQGRIPDDVWALKELPEEAYVSP